MNEHAQQIILATLDDISPNLVNKQDARGFTPLHIAALNGEVAMAKRLLNKDALVDVRDNNNATPLQLALATGNLHMIALLMAANASIDIRNNENNTPLHIVAGNQDEKKHEEIELIIDLLIAKGNDVNDKNQYQATPLHMAIIAKNKWIANLLVERYGADLNAVDCNGRTPFMLAEELFATDTDWLLSLEKASYAQEEAKKAEEIRIKQLSNKRHSLPSAEELIQRDEKRKKLEPRKEFDLSVLESSLTLSEVVRIPDIVHIPAIDATALQAVNEAISADNPGTLELYIEGLGTDFKDSEGNTYLHLAVKNNSLQIVIFLLSILSGEQLEAINREDKTPLMLAKELQHQGIIAILEEKLQAKVSTIENDIFDLCLLGEDELAEGRKTRESFIVQLIQAGNVDELGRMLFEYEIDINTRYENKNTLLHIAVISKNLASVKFLLDYTMTEFINTPNNQGKTPLDLAVEADPDSEISKLLQTEKNKVPDTRSWQDVQSAYSANIASVWSEFMARQGDANRAADTDNTSFPRPPGG